MGLDLKLGPHKLSADQMFQTKIISDQTFQAKITSDQTFQTYWVSDQNYQSERVLIRPSPEHVPDSTSEQCPDPYQTMIRRK